jgi:hypothetical protein
MKNLMQIITIAIRITIINPSSFPPSNLYILQYKMLRHSSPQITEDKNSRFFPSVFTPSQLINTPLNSIKMDK